MDEFLTFIEKGILEKSSIIEEFDKVKVISEAAYSKDDFALKKNFEPEYFYNNLPKWSQNLAFIASDEDIYWFTSDYDDFGVYKGKLNTAISNIAVLFELGVSEVTIISKSLDTFLSFDTYVYCGKYFQEIQLYGRYQELFLGELET